MASISALIFGGSGKVARHVTKLLVAEGATVHSIIRKPEQKASIEALGGKPIVESIEASSVDDMAATITSAGANVVLWCAGAGGGSQERTLAVDRDGAIKTMDATVKAGVKRYIIVSAIDVRDREGKGVPEWYDAEDRSRSDRVWGAIGPYMKAKLEADVSLVTENARRGLDYTILRPGGLSDDVGTGKIVAGKIHMHNTISREDVAAVVVACVYQPSTAGLAIDFVNGDTPVADAIAEVAKNRVNTFEGHY